MRDLLHFPIHASLDARGRWHTPNDISAARGCIYGILIGLGMWAGIIWLWRVL